MKLITRYLPAALALGLLGSTAQAEECDVKGRTVVEVMTDEVGTYDSAGNFIADVGKAEIPLNQPILACKTSPALVQVSLTPGSDKKARTAWVNLLEVKIGGNTLVARKCKDESVSRLADTASHATSGIDSCSNAQSK
jgi:hypothetical protein